MGLDKWDLEGSELINGQIHQLNHGVTVLLEGGEEKRWGHRKGALRSCILPRPPPVLPSWLPDIFYWPTSHALPTMTELNHEIHEPFLLFLFSCQGSCISNKTAPHPESILGAAGTRLVWEPCKSIRQLEIKFQASSKPQGSAFLTYGPQIYGCQVFWGL